MLKSASKAPETYQPDMPPLECGEYLIGYLYEIGPTSGEEAITQPAIRAWQDNIGIELPPWQVRLLRRLSIDYLSESHQARKRDCPAPWGDVHLTVQAIQLKARMRELANS